jgi:hypothetical protein
MVEEVFAGDDALSRSTEWAVPRIMQQRRLRINGLMGSVFWNNES